MKVLGIDPGLQVSGYAVVELCAQEVKVCDAGTIRADTDLPLEQRLEQIYQDVEGLFNEHEIDICAVEQLYAHYKR